MKRIQLSAIAALAALGLVAAACGQPLTTTEQTQTAQAVLSPAATTATLPSATTTAGATMVAATATAQPTPPSPPQLLAEAPGKFVTPTAAGSPGARPDCADGWGTYADLSGLISLCAPVGTVVVADITANGEPGITLGSDVAGTYGKDVPSFAIVIRLTSQSVIPFGPDLSSYCSAAGGTATQVALDLGAFPASGCADTVELDSSAGPLRTLRLVAPLTPSPMPGLNFVRFIINWRTQSMGAEAVARAMASSLKVSQ